MGLSINAIKILDKYHWRNEMKILVLSIIALISYESFAIENCPRKIHIPHVDSATLELVRLKGYELDDASNGIIDDLYVRYYNVRKNASFCSNCRISKAGFAVYESYKSGVREGGVVDEFRLNKSISDKKEIYTRAAKKLPRCEEL